MTYSRRRAAPVPGGGAALYPDVAMLPYMKPGERVITLEKCRVTGELEEHENELLDEQRPRLFVLRCLHCYPRRDHT